MTQINLPTYEQQEQILEAIQSSGGSDIFNGTSISQTFTLGANNPTLTEFLNLEGRFLVTSYKLACKASPSGTTTKIELYVNGNFLDSLRADYSETTKESLDWLVGVNSIIVKGSTSGTIGSNYASITIHGVAL